MIENIIEFLQNLPPRWIVFWIATLPVSELRGAIPIGHTLLEMPMRSAYLWAVLGNLLPVIPLLLFLAVLSPASSITLGAEHLLRHDATRQVQPGHSMFPATVGTGDRDHAVRIR